MRFIEFAGLPGSGKTTVARELERRLTRAGLDCLTRERLAADGSGVVVRHLRRAWLILGQMPRAAAHYRGAARFVAASGQARPAAALKVFWNLCTVIALMARHRGTRNAVLIVDQGLAQAVWSVGLGARDDEAGIGAWREFIEAIGVRDVGFVLLNVPPEIAGERLAARPARTSRMQDAAWAADPAIWRRADNLYRRLAAGLSALAADGAQACIELDSAGFDPARAAAEIESRLFPETALQEPDDANVAKAGDLVQHELERGQFPLGPHRGADGARL